MPTSDRVRFQITLIGAPTFTRVLADGREAWFFVPDPVRPVKPRTRAADRTRSPRWRAGTRREKQAARRRRPVRDPWAGWTDLGWVDETQGYSYS